MDIYGSLYGFAAYLSWKCSSITPLIRKLSIVQWDEILQSCNKVKASDPRTSY